MIHPQETGLIWDIAFALFWPGLLLIFLIVMCMWEELTE